MPATAPVTADELLHMGEGKRELIRGEIVELEYAGARHGQMQAHLGYLLDQFAEDQALGDCVVSGCGFQLTFDPDTVRAPDVALVNAARIAGYENEIGYLPFAPDLAVEIVEPWDSFAEVESKTRMWLESGARVVWVVEPDSRRVFIYQPGKDRRELGEDDTLDAPGILPGFSVPVSRLFP